MTEEMRNDNSYIDRKPDEPLERTPREEETREKSARPSDAWVPPSHLPKPNPIPGWVFRWIRTSTLDRADLKNVSRRTREGWVPVLAKDHPELQVQSDIGTRWEDGVEIGGLLLCKAPEELVARRRAYYQNMNEEQVRAVDEDYMREKDSRLPKFSDKKSRTSFGSG
jgi:hypothetical protein